MNYRPYIDGLRAIAVLSVVSFHAFPTWFRGGFIGVDIFFVISGFLISTILFEGLEKGTFSFSEFYARRIKRIFPALLLVLICCFAFGWFTLLPDEYKLLGKYMAGGAGFISNFIFWNEAGYFDKVAETKPLLHLWSLGVEEQFYIIWPLLLWGAYKLRLNLLVITVVIAIISFVLNLQQVKIDVVAAFYSPQTRFWELLCGSILAWLMLNKQSTFAYLGNQLNHWLNKLIYREPQQHADATLSNTLSFAGFLLIIFGLYYITKGALFPGVWALIPVLGAILILAAGANAWFNRVVLSNKLLVWFGLISYPLYLWHWALLSFGHILEGGELSRKIRLILVTVSILLAWLTYRLVERPIRFGGHGKAKVFALLFLMIIVGYVGLNTFQRNGLVFRFPKIVSQLVEVIDFEWPSYIRNGICHIQDMKRSMHDEICHEKKRPLVVLWGDSHASSLYPGLKKLQQLNNFGLTQLTQAGCGPIFDLQKFESTRENCNLVNQIILRHLAVDKPDAIVLHGAWVSDDFKISPDNLRIKFKRTIDEVKLAAPYSKIIVIGPMPRWKESPQKTSYLYWLQQVDKVKPVPIFQKANLLVEVDKILSDISNDAGLIYISSIYNLCNSDGCISKVGESSKSFIAVDYAHLSKAGSEYFIDQVQDVILKALK